MKKPEELKHVRYENLYQQRKSQNKNGWQSDEEDSEVFNWIFILLKLSGVKTGKLLEVGCGAGNLSSRLIDLGFELTGVDISPTAITWAKKRFDHFNKETKFIVGDVSNLNLLDSDGFDIVVDSLCLHCLIENDRSKAISEIHRVLKEKGDFLVVSMCGNPRGEELTPHFNPTTRYVEFDGIPECYFGRAEDILEELRRVNFEIVHYQVIDGNDKTGDQDMLLAVCRK